MSSYSSAQPVSTDYELYASVLASTTPVNYTAIAVTIATVIINLVHQFHWPDLYKQREINNCQLPSNFLRIKVKQCENRC